MSQRILLRMADLEWRVVEREVVALDVSDSEYLAVNESGTLMWEALALGTTRVELVRLLMDTYALDQTAAERDTDAFLAELGRRGLLAQDS